VGKKSKRKSAAGAAPESPAQAQKNSKAKATAAESVSVSAAAARILLTPRRVRRRSGCGWPKAPLVKVHSNKAKKRLFEGFISFCTCPGTRARAWMRVGDHPTSASNTTTSTSVTEDSLPEEEEEAESETEEISAGHAPQGEPEQAPEAPVGGEVAPEAEEDGSG
jgi:hypothetical protein